MISDLATKATLFGASIAAIPAVDVVQPEGWIERMAKGSAQLILSVCVIALGYGLVKMFIQYRLDMRKENEKAMQLAKENMKALETFHKQNQDVITQNSIALQGMAKAQEHFRNLCERYHSKKEG